MAPYTNYVLGQLHGSENRDSSIFYYKKYVSLIPYSAYTFFNLGVAYSELGKIDSTINCFKKSIEIKPDYRYERYDFKVYNSLTRWRSNKECNERALARMNSFLEIK